jgi:hypothetical protein
MGRLIFVTLIAADATSKAVLFTRHLKISISMDVAKCLTAGSIAPTAKKALERSTP